MKTDLNERSDGDRCKHAKDWDGVEPLSAEKERNDSRGIEEEIHDGGNAEQCDDGEPRAIVGAKTLRLILQPAQDGNGDAPDRPRELLKRRNEPSGCFGIETECLRAKGTSDQDAI